MELVLVGFFLWLLILTFLLFRTLINYNQLTEGVTKQTLSEVLKKLLDQSKKSRSEYKKIIEQIDQIKTESVNYIQKIGVVRFNPFDDIGGDQSFVIALLDSRDNGVVVTSLYARSSTRWYVKQVKAGKGVKLELSKEEKEAVKKSQPNLVYQS